MRPGCSSCVKVREFLARIGLDYESIDVAARPRSRRSSPLVERWLALLAAEPPVGAEDFAGLPMPEGLWE